MLQGEVSVFCLHSLLSLAQVWQQTSTVCSILQMMLAASLMASSSLPESVFTMADISTQSRGCSTSQSTQKVTVVVLARRRRRANERCLRFIVVLKFIYISQQKIKALAPIIAGKLNLIYRAWQFDYYIWSKHTFSFIITTNSPNMKRILCIFTVNPDFVQFAIPELKALLSNAPIPLETLLSQQLLHKEYKHGYEINHKLFDYFPFIILTVPDYEKHKEYFQNLGKEAVMVLKMILLISSGKDYEELLQNGDVELLERVCRNDQELVLCDFYSHNRVVAREDQVAQIHSVLGKFDIRGKVNFKQPKIRYQLLEEHRWYPNHHKDCHASTLRQVYFGIELCSNKIATAKFNNKFELNKRIYLGPTSTDNDLAFLMCNQALIGQYSLVIDPFVGTGGLLIPPATKGAITFGSDLDIRVINGYSVGRINKRAPYYKAEMKYELFTPKINLNFEQYELNTPNIIRIDSTRLAFREGEFFDAIITDPPYGIRAMSRSVSKKVDKEEESQPNIQVEKEQKHQQLDEIESEQGEKEPQQSLQEKQQGQIQKHTQAQQMEKQSEQALKAKKRQKRKYLRQNKKKRRDLVPEQQKQYKQNLMKKLNRERVDQWQKYDKGKIQTTQRQIIFASLLAFARKYLRKNGRLVFLFPVYEEEEYLGVANLPEHDGFAVIDLSENKMSKGNSRVLVTLEKL